MTPCPVCGDKGVCRVRYHDGAPDDYGVCRCAAGQALRDDRNAGVHTGYPLWMAWAARRGINQEHVGMVEDLLGIEQLATIPPADPRPTGSSIADALRTKRPRL